MNRFLLTSILLLTFIRLFAISPSDFNPNVPPPDTIDPIIMCPPSDTILLDSGICTVNYLYSVTATDDQGTAILVQISGLSSGASFPMGITICSFLAVDLAGNSASCSFNISVRPTNPIILQCDDLVNINLGTNCITNIVPAQILEAVDSLCLGYFIVELDKTAPFGNGPWVPALVGSSDVGKTYQVRVSDPFTTIKCWGNVKINDVTPPVINCLPITVPCIYEVFTPTFLKDSLGIAAGKPTAVDACNPNVSNFNFTDNNQAFNCDTVDYTRRIFRTWTANDASGNIGSCVQRINVRKINYNEIIFPQDTVVDCTANIPTPAQSGSPYVQFNNRKFSLDLNLCDITAIKYDSITYTLCGGLRRVFRIWEIYNNCNPAQVFNTQVIDFQDENRPIVTCPPAQTISLALTNCKGSVDLPDAVVTDLCTEISKITAVWINNGNTVVLDGSLSDFAMNNPIDPRDTLGVIGVATDLPAGTTIIRYLADDDCGNQGSCTFLVTITDSIPPIALCDILQTVQVNPQGTMTTPASLFDNGSTDGCTNTLFFAARWVTANPCQLDTLFHSTLNQCCSIVGDTLPLKLRIYDIPVPSGGFNAGFGTGHYTECNTKIAITDPHPLQCAAPKDTTVLCKNFNSNLSAAYGNIVSTSCKTDSMFLDNDYTSFDTACKKGTIIRKFKVFDQNGASAQCTQRVVSNYEQDYYIRFPDDRIITACTANGQYGQPEFFGLDCELIHIEYTDIIITVVNDACFRIDRLWTIYNGCNYDPMVNLTAVPNPMPSNTTNAPINLAGPTISQLGTTGVWAPTIVKVNPFDISQTNYGTFWSPNSNGYTYKQSIKVIDTSDPFALNCVDAQAFVIADTTQNDPLFWNDIYWWDNVNMTHDLSEGFSDLSITATDLCSGANINIEYQLTLDTDADGIQETIISSTNLPGYNRIFVGNNDGDLDLNDGTSRAFDNRAVTPSDKYGFVIYETVNGLNKTASVRWNTQVIMQQQSPPASSFVLAQLPYGTHNIKWTISDACGNDVICQQNFIVAAAPKILCKTSPVLIPLNGIGKVLVHIDDLHNGIIDSNAPLDSIETAIRLAGTGTGFPPMPVQQLLFSCADTGTVFIEIWAKDESNLVTSCQVEVEIMDTTGVCGVNANAFSGSLKLVSGEGLLAGSVFFENQTGTVVQELFPHVLSDTEGLFDVMGLATYASDNYARPAKTDDYLNGVTTFDLVLMSKHILGVDTLDSPYKLIAADANRSGSITTFDIVELRRLILGFNQVLPNSGSWRFIDADHTFANPMNPFVPPYPEKISLLEIKANDLDFIAVKVGDMNDNAMPNALAFGDDRAEKTIYLDFENKKVVAGENVSITFKASEPVSGIQGRIQYPGLKLLEVIPKTPMNMDHFEVKRLENAFALACEQGGQYTFTVQFESLINGELKDLLSIENGSLRAEAYQERAKGSYERMDLALRHTNALTFALYQNQPNPFKDATDVSFYLPESSDATLNITDLEGRTVWQQRAFYEKGTHTLPIRKEQLPESGVYNLTLTTAQYRGNCRMVLIKSF